MDSNTISRVVTHLRDPLDSHKRIHFTARSLRFICLLFEGKNIDTIELHYLLLRLAAGTGALSSSEVVHLTLTNILTHFLFCMPTCVTTGDLITVASTFDIQYDNEHGEVAEMKTLLDSIELSEE